MKEIKLTKNQVALVDDADYEWLIQWKWQAKKSKRSNCYYAVRGSWNNIKKRTDEIGMHRVILNTVGTKICCDHIDRNGLNNQRYNLRIATHSQNCANIAKRKNATSKYMGVSLRKATGRWRAEIRKNWKGIRLGEYVNEIDAAIAYNNAAIKLHGEFANLNKV